MNEVLLLVGLGGGSTLLTQVTKRIAKLNKDNEHDWVIRLLFHAFSFGGTVLSFVVGAHALSIVNAIVHMLSLEGSGTAVYPFVKVADKWLTKVQKGLKIVDAEEPKLEELAKSGFVGSVPTVLAVTSPNTKTEQTATAPADF